MKLWDLASKICLAHLEFHRPLHVGVQISFATNATSIFRLKHSGGIQSWRISHNHNIDGTKLPMVFGPIMEGCFNWNASTPWKSYHYDTDGEWILDQDERHILWMPLDERPQKIWSSFKRETKVIAIQTKNGQVYIVNFSQS
jgi:hypothetical protein